MRERTLVSLLALALALCVLATLADGTPKKLPGPALESIVLLHVERTAALFAAVLLFTLVLVNSAAGRLPVELSGRGIKYEQFSEAKSETELALEALVEAVESLHAR